MCLAKAARVLGRRAERGSMRSAVASEVISSMVGSGLLQQAWRSSAFVLMEARTCNCRCAGVISSVLGAYYASVALV